MSGRRLAFAVTMTLAAALPSASATTTPGPGSRQVHLDDATSAAASGPEDVRVRRWEYVVLVRVDPEVKDALGRAEVAAFKAGGAVLDDLHVESTESHADWRILVRTRDQQAVNAVVREVRATRGVLGATATPLPETPTYPGGPDFFASYSSEDGSSPDNAGRIVMHHDVPPVADKKELLEMADVLAPPSAGPDGTGGFTLNISELFARMKEGAWRRREDRLRNTPIEVLPPAPAATAGN